MKTTSSRIRAYFYACIYLPSFIFSDLLAATLYWDANGTNLGAGTTPTGIWGTDSYWNTSSTGGAGTFTTMLGATLAAQKLNIASFSAGTDAVNAYTVTVNGTQGAMGINFVDGATTLTGGTIALPSQANNVTPTAGLAKIWNDSTTTGTSTINSNITFPGGGAANSVLTLVAGDGAADLDLLINGTITQLASTPEYLLKLGGAGNGKITSDLGLALGQLQQGDTSWDGTWTISGNQTWATTAVPGGSIILSGGTFGPDAQLIMGDSLSDVQKIQQINVTGANQQLIIKSTLSTLGNFAINSNTDTQIPGNVTVGTNTYMANSKLTLSDGVTAGHYTSTSGFSALTGSTNSVVGGSPQMSTLEILNSQVLANVTFGGPNTYDNNISLVKSSSSSLSLFNVSTYTGDTLVNAGTLLLRAAGQLGDTDTKVATGATFNMADNSIYNMVVDGLTSTTITGTGTVSLNGDFNFNLTSAALAWGNSWQVVANSTLTETYGSTFNVVGFTETANVWKKPVTLGGTVGYWQFSEATGVLSLIPEPSTILCSLMGSLLVMRRRKTNHQ